jgi:hypothetical protein
MKQGLTRPLVALGVVAAIAFPAVAAAKHGGNGHGNEAQHGKKGQHGGKNHVRRGRALVVRGTVAAVGTGTVDVTVSGANHHGRALKGQTVTFDLTGARIVVRDVNSDGKRDLSDVQVGDRVLVQARIQKGAAPDTSQPIVAQRLVDKGQPKPADSGDSSSQDTSDQPLASTP